MKTLNWYQNKIVSQVSFISAVIAILTAAMSIAWNIRVTGEMAKDVSWLKEKQIQQLQINARTETVLQIVME